MTDVAVHLYTRLQLQDVAVHLYILFVSVFWHLRAYDTAVLCYTVLCCIAPDMTNVTDEKTLRVALLPHVVVLLNAVVYAAEVTCLSLSSVSYTSTLYSCHTPLSSHKIHMSSHMFSVCPGNLDFLMYIRESNR